MEPTKQNPFPDFFSHLSTENAAALPDPLIAFPESTAPSKSLVEREVTPAAGVESIDRGLYILGLLGDSRHSVLWEQARIGNCDYVKRLLELGVDPDVKTSGSTPLYTAAYKGYCVVVKLLLKFGASVDKGNNNGWTPFLIALYHEHFEVAKLLLKNDANINAVSKSEIGALQIVVEREYDNKVLKMLLESRADPNISGGAPLVISAKKNQSDAVEMLLDYNAKINSTFNSGRTALHWAAYHGNNEMTETLLSRDANPHIKDKKGKKSYDLAVEKSHGDTAALLKQGIDESLVIKVKAPKKSRRLFWSFF